MIFLIGSFIASDAPYVFMSSPIPSKLQLFRCLATSLTHHRFTQPHYSTLDAAEWAPSTSSLADIATCPLDVRLMSVRDFQCTRRR
jgi:hypothetical protein